MNDDLSNDAVLRLLRLLADRLESFLDGDELALETLGECIEEDGFTADEVQAAVMVLRSLGGDGPGHGVAAVDGTPGSNAQRVLSAEERESLSPEAWGYLIDLRRRGSLNPAQVERVLDVLTGCGVWPVGVDLAREVASRVALEPGEAGEGGETPHGDADVVH